MKPVIFVERRILNTKSSFGEKLLCDGLTFTAGDSCRYSCQFCFVESMGITRNDLPPGVKHEEVVIRRKNAVEKLRSQLLNTKGKPRYDDPNDTRVIYASPLVDIAADIELCKETIAMCEEILRLTHWQIRLLSKSNLLPYIAKALGTKDARNRVIYGVSTGTVDNGLAKSFEKGTPLVSKRIESLHWLQNEGFRTYGMICPSLPRPRGDYAEFSEEICEKIRIERCEHVWAEVINVRGDSLTATATGLRAGGHTQIAEALEGVSGNTSAWEKYNQDTFLGHTKNIPAEKLRYLTYVTPKTLSWWQNQVGLGAVLLGKAAAAPTK